IPASSPREITLSIHNHTANSITLPDSPPVVVVDAGAGFKVSSYPGSPVVAGQPRQFKISFAPGGPATGTKQTEVRFANSLPGKSPFKFTLRGTAKTAFPGAYRSIGCEAGVWVILRPDGKLWARKFNDPWSQLPAVGDKKIVGIETLTDFGFMVLTDTGEIAVRGPGG